jgi:hypothetical protein
LPEVRSHFHHITEILAGCDTLYSLSREPQDDLRTLKLIKSRSALDSAITFRVDWDVPEMIPVDNVKVTTRREYCSLISAILRGHPEGVPQSAIVQQMAQHDVSRTATRRLLDSHDGGLWSSSGGGRGVPRVYVERITIQ